MKPSTDTVPAMLTPGEFVIRKDAAEEIGPEKLNMLNNIDRLGQSALLENARSPMGYQEGGDVKSGGFFSLFKDKVGGFFEQQGKNWERAAEMEEKIGVRNPFLKTAEEQLALQGKKQLTPEPIYRPEIAIDPIEVDKSPEMLGDASLYSSPTEQAYQESLPAQEQIARKYGILQEAGQPTQLGVRSQDPKQLLEKTLAGIKAEYTPTEQAYLKSLPAMDEIERKYQIQEILTSKAPDMGMRLSDSLDVHPTMLAMQNPGRPYVKPGGSEVAPMLSDVAMPNDWTNQFELPETVEDWGRAPEEPRVSWGDLSAYDKLGMMLMGENKWDNLRGKSRRIMSGKEGSAQGYDYKIPGAPTFRDVMGFQDGGQVYADKETVPYKAGKRDQLSGGTAGREEERDIMAQRVLYPTDHFVRGSAGPAMGVGALKGVGLNLLLNSLTGGATGGYNALAALTGAVREAKKWGSNKTQIERMTEGKRPFDPVHFRKDYESGDVYSATKKGWRKISPDAVAKMEEHFPDYMKSVDRYQEGGPVMHNKGEGQMKDTLSVFGEKSQDADGLQKLLATVAMQQMQRAQQVQPQSQGFEVGAFGALQEGGYIPQYQQGGPVKPPMSGGEEGPQQVPMPSGQQAYHKPPMEQLGMDPFEYDSYLKYGPELYKYFPQNFKPKEQWTAYDSLVSDGIIDPYKVSKDSINVLTDDQLNELLGQRKPPQ